jgi:hypothetical protein
MCDVLLPPGVNPTVVKYIHKWNLTVFTVHTFHSVKKLGIFFWGGGRNSSNSGKTLTFQKILRITVGSQPAPRSCRSLLKQLIFCLSMPAHTFINEPHYLYSGMSKQVHLYKTLIHQIRTICKDQMSFYFALKTYVVCWHQQLQHCATSDTVQSVPRHSGQQP